eukprot:XP_012815119.1 PREDICTED: protein transport protein Sec24A-like isoform X2 [Xenopus tropicalis]
MPAKAAQHPGHGQQNSSVPQMVPQLGGLQTVHQLSGPQNFPQLPNYPVSGQTINIPPMGHTPMTSPQHTGARSRMPPPPQNSAGEPATAVSNASQGNVPPQSNWQYFPTPLSHAQPQPFANHIYSSAGPTSGQPSSQSNSVPPTTHQYAASFGGPPLQNSFMNQGPPPMSQPGQPTLGAHPTSSPSRSLAPPPGPPGATLPPPPLQSAPPKPDGKLGDTRSLLYQDTSMLSWDWFSNPLAPKGHEVEDICLYQHSPLNCLLLWDLRRDTPVMEMKNHEEYISDMAIDENKKMLLTASTRSCLDLSFTKLQLIACPATTADPFKRCLPDGTS